MRGRAWRVLWLALGILGCGEDPAEFRVVFPDVETRRSTQVLRWKTFEPVLSSGAFLPCSQTRTFGKSSGLSFDALDEQVPVLGGSTELSVGPGFSHQVQFPKPSTSNRNPWGAVSLIVEGQAELGPFEDRMPRMVPVVAGCQCARTETEGRHPDPNLDALVKESCPPLEGIDTLRLESVVSRAFTLETCGFEELSAPQGGVLRPGVRACVRPVSCEEDPVHCQSCDADCLGQLGSAPVRIQLSGEGLTPTNILESTEDDGSLEWTERLEGCQDSFEVTAELLGRPDSSLTLRGRCFDPPSPLSCTGSMRIGGVIGTSIAAVAADPYDSIAVLTETSRPTSRGMGRFEARIDVVNPRTEERSFQWSFPDERPATMHSFSGSREGEPPRPLLAVATVDVVASEVRVRVLSFDGQGQVTSTSTLSAPCGVWTCGSLEPCSQGCRADEVCNEDGPAWCVLPGELAEPACPAGPVGCGCRLAASSPSDVSLTSAHLDEDGRLDLVVGSRQVTAVTTWLSSETQLSQPAFSERHCRCGRYSQLPTSLAVAPFNGEDAVPDLLFSSDGALSFRAGEVLPSGEPVLRCGLPSWRSRRYVPQAIKLMRAGCSPGVDATCGPVPDLVMLERAPLSGGTPDVFPVDLVWGAPSITSSFERTWVADGNDFIVADLNRDQREDLVVHGLGKLDLFFGQPGQSLGWADLGTDFSECRVPCSLEEGQLAAANLEGDGRLELVGACRGLLQWFTW